MSSNGTRVDEIADGIFRISTPVVIPEGNFGFTFNQYLIRDEQPLLFHTGPRQMFSATREAVSRVLAPEKLRYVGLSHYEADECGALNEFLAIAPVAQPLCGSIAALISIGDTANRPPRALKDGEELPLGRHTVRWLDTPHLPHGWECGYLFESSTATLLCGDLLTQPGDKHVPITEGDILGPSEAFRGHMDYYAHSKDTRKLLEKVANTRPRTLACMHGSAWRGDGAKLLMQLATSLDA
jgi:flavorubredoxin